MVLTTKRNFENKLEQNLNLIKSIEKISFEEKNKTDIKNISEAKQAIKKSVQDSKEYQIGIIQYPRIKTSFWKKQNLYEFSKSLDNFYKQKYEQLQSKTL